MLRAVAKVKGFFKGMLPRTLFGRSLLILVTPIFLVQIITTYIFFDRHWQKMSDRMAYAIAAEISVLARELQHENAEANFGGVVENARLLSFVLEYRPGRTLTSTFYDEKSAPLNPSRENIIAQSLAKALDQQMRDYKYDINVDRDEKWVNITLQLPKGVMSVTLPERRIFSSSGYVVLIWMVGSSIILLIIATLFMRNQIRPIRRLAIAAERFGKGRDVPFFKVEGAREVRQAARAFIDMKSRLQRQIQQRTAMLAGVSHDLRTPLTRMKLQLELMGGSEDVLALKNDVVDMERMIEAYLQFARGEGGEEVMRTDLKDLIEQVARSMNRDGERVRVSIPDDVTLLLRPVAFERCITNILGNALKYGSEAWVSVQKFGENIEICIDDNGPGIPREQYEDVFKPFFRGEASRNSKTGGVGLGLPIVQEIVLAHGGAVWLDSSPKGGLRVVIDLPL